MQQASAYRTHGKEYTPRKLHGEAFAKDVPRAPAPPFQVDRSLVLPITPRRSRSCVASFRGATSTVGISSLAVDAVFARRKTRTVERPRLVRLKRRSCGEQRCNCAIWVHLDCESFLGWGQKFHSIPPRGMEIVSHFRRLCRHRRCLSPPTLDAAEERGGAVEEFSRACRPTVYNGVDPHR